jgi:hypothetical protein
MPAHLPIARKNFVVSQSMHLGNVVQLRVLGSQPPSVTAVPAEPSLEDAYTDLLARGAHSARGLAEAVA